MATEITDPGIRKRVVDLLLDEPSAFVYIVNMSTQRFVFVSSSASRLLGYSCEELCSEDAPLVSDFLISPEGEKGGEATIGRMLTVRHCDGTTRYLESREVVVGSDGAGGILLLGYGRDVTRPRETASVLGLHKYLLRTLNRIVQRFSQQSAIDDVAGSVTDAMGLLGPIVGASQCHLCRIDDRDRLPIKISMVHEWFSPGGKSAAMGFQYLPVNLFPWFFQQLEDREVLYLSQRSSIPQSDRVLAALLTARGIHKYLVLPLVTDNQTWGYLGLVPDEAAMAWDDDIVALLRLAGQVFVNRLSYYDASNQIVLSEQRWRQTADAAYDVVLFLDTESVIIEAGAKRSDLSYDAYTGSSIYNVVAPNSYREVRTAITAALEASDPAEGARELEIQAIGRGGDLIWYRARIGPQIRNDQVVGVTVFCTVIQDQKEATAAINELKKDLEHASRLSVLGQMATEIAHELNQPLQVIASYAQGLRLRIARQQEGDELLDVLDHIGAAADDAAQTIKNIREFVRQRGVDVQLCSMSDIIDSTRVLVEPVVREFNAHVSVNVEADLPEIVANPAQINHVLMNLIINGIEAAAESVLLDHIEIHVDCRQSDCGTRIEVTVSDNGPGVPPDKREAIFNRYVTTKKTGLGVGLASSRDVIQRYGGRLALLEPNSGRPGGGARFQFTLPLAETEARDLTADDTE